MRATIKNYLDAEKKRREEQGEEGGFSLIELIVVIVILGILLAIAIPIFANLQQTANQRALESITANAASQVAAQLAQNPALSLAGVDFTNFTSEANAPAGLSLAATSTDPNSQLDTFCVTGTAEGLTAATSGPGCE